MDRRDFIKLTAVTGTTATLAGCGNPEHTLIRFVPDDDTIPGIAEYKPSVCPLCSAGCGVTARVMEADVETIRNGQSGVVKMAIAKKLEGTADHPISRGGTCVRGQAAIQVTYHPDRIRHPLKRSGARGSGEFNEISWDDAIAELTGKLDALATAGDQKSLVLLTRPRRSRRQELLAEFARTFGAPAPFAFEALGNDVLRRANGLSFGHEQLPTFDFGRSRYIFSFGADFLGTWNSPVAQNAAYGQMRQGRPGVRGKLVQTEARMSLTGASADEWLPVTPGTEGVLALGLAHVILRDKLRPSDAAGRAGTLIDGWSAGLADYAPPAAAKITNVTAKRIERLAHEIVEYRPAVAVIAGPPLAQTNGLFSALAVNALNALLGSVGTEGGIFFTPASLKSEVSSLKAADLGAAKLVLLDEANPVYASPKALKIREALEKVPFIASFGSFIDDTSVFADLILPDHSFLESWVDSTPESGSIEAVTTVAGPAMKPIHNTRATADVLIAVAGKLKTPLGLPWKDAEEVANSKPNLQSPLQSAIRNPQSAMRYVEPRFDGDPAAYPFHFLPYASQAFSDGSTAHLPWLQELPDPMTSAMWSSWIEINPQTADRMKIAQGDMVDVTSSQGTLRAAAMISPGIAPDVIGMPMGQGHEAFTRFATKRGANPMAILAPLAEAETGALAWAATRVKIARAGDADGSLIMFAGEMREHPHDHETR